MKRNGKRFASSAVLAAAALVLLACGRNGEDGPICSGELNPEAAVAARGYRASVVLWLGESFQDLHLTHTEPLNGGDGLLLVYGGCQKSLGREGGSTPPLQIQAYPPGGIPEIARVDPVPFRGIDRTPGEPGALSDSSAVLWFPNGDTIKLYSQGWLLEEVSLDDVLGKLETANHGALGLDAVGSGESLGALSP